MPIIGSRGAASGFGFGQRQGGKTFDLHYMIVAGGGSGGKDLAGGGGGGGFRLSFGSTPLSSQSEITVDGGTPYTVTIGGGGPGGQPNASGSN